MILGCAWEMQGVVAQPFNEEKQPGMRSFHGLGSTGVWKRIGGELGLLTIWADLKGLEPLQRGIPMVNRSCRDDERDFCENL